MRVSLHYQNDKRKREKIITKVIGDCGNIIDSFEIDRGHKDGAEIHSITDMGIIIIRNKETNKLVTKLIARPHQITRYYKDVDRNPPKWLLDLCKWHRDLHYNV